MRGQGRKETKKGGLEGLNKRDGVDTRQGKRTLKMVRPVATNGATCWLGGVWGVLQLWNTTL